MAKPHKGVRGPMSQCRAQLNAQDRVLGANRQILACSSSPSTLGTYKTGMWKLRQLHIVQPTWGCYKLVEQVVCDTIRDGKGSGQDHPQCSGNGMHLGGIVRDPVPKRLWMAFKASQCL